MIKEIQVNSLTPGDWILNKEIRSKFKISNLGIEPEQIIALKKSKIKTIQVKEGIPFAPSFLLAYLVTMLSGNLILTFLKIML